MEILRVYIMNIGYFMIFSALVRLFMPGGSFRAYVDMFLGLIFMMIMLNPISAFIKTGLPMLEDYILKSGVRISDDIYDGTSAMENEDMIYREYSHMLIERIKTIAEGYIDSPEVDVETDGKLKPESIVVVGIGSRESAEELEKTLDGIFGEGKTEVIRVNYLKKLFEKKDKKTFVNLFTAFAVGIGLIAIGGMFDGKKPEKNPVGNEITAESEKSEEGDYSYKAELEEQLERTLGKVEGVGRIEVMISLKDSGESRLAQDIQRERSVSENGDNSEKEEYKTLLTEGSQPYIINKSRPEIEGVLIIAEGGGNASVKSSLISACSALFGIEANKTEVLKMGGN